MPHEKENCLARISPNVSLGISLVLIVGLGMIVEHEIADEIIKERSTLVSVSSLSNVLWNFVNRVYEYRKLVDSLQDESMHELEGDCYDNASLESF